MAKPIVPNATRSDLHRLPPYSVLVDEKFRGREFPPPDKDILDMAVEFRTPGQGQLTPCEVRKDGLTYTLAYGFSRMAAARLNVDGFTHEGVVYEPMPDFLLEVKNIGSDELGALVRNALENNSRTAPSVIDDAHLQNMLRIKGMDDEGIAKVYRCSVQTIRDRQKLLSLTKEHRMLVHAGTISLSVALRLLDLTEADRKIEVDRLLKEGGKITVEVVNKLVRDHQLRDNPTAVGAIVGSRAPHIAAPKPPTPKAIATFYETEARFETPIAPYTAKMADFVKGKVSEADLKTTLDELADKLEARIKFDAALVEYAHGTMDLADMKEILDEMAEKFVTA